MKYRVSLVLCVIGQLVLTNACGKTLEKGTLMCALSNEQATVVPFDFTQCTHAFVDSSVECYGDKCTFMNPSDIEEDVRWASTYFPDKVGIFLPVNHNILDYLLSSKLRISNTANELVQVIQDKGLKFIVILNATENIGSSKVNRENYFVFLQELANKLHARSLHIGQQFSISSDTELLFNFNVERMSALVDWFQFAPLRFSSGYMQPYAPLTSSYGDPRGSTKYWIEKVLQLIRPECLVIDIGPRIRKQVAIGAEVEPGLGSLATRSVWRGIKVSGLCTKLYLSSKCKKYWDEESKTPWAVCGDDFYSFDDARSLELKANLLRQYNVTGLLFWASDVASPDNICENGEPLSILRAVQGFRQKKDIAT